MDQGGRIIQQTIDRRNATAFFAMFWSREDVFAKRAKMANTIRNVIIDGTVLCARFKKIRKYIVKIVNT